MAEGPKIPAEVEPLLVEEDEGSERENVASGSHTSSRVELRPKNNATSERWLLLALCAIILLAVGLVFGIYFAPVVRSPPDSYLAWQKLLKGEDEWVSDKLMKYIKKENIERHLRYLTSRPHVAGTPIDKVNAEYVMNELLKSGVDSAEVIPYDILLSYPDLNNPNKVQILEEDGTVIFTSHLYETPVTPDEDVSDIIPPYNAFAPNGTVEGEVVFANFGEVNDFLRLERELNINVTDKIVLVKYGKIFRGSKVKFAQEAGAKGVIIYSDPESVALNGVDDVYPDSWWLPGTAVERGTLWELYGDPLTPAYPSIDGAYREPEDTVLEHLKIPVQPIGYKDAAHILSQLGGAEAPKDWWGTLNLTYCLGPTLNNNRRVRLEVGNRNQRNYTYTAVGTFKGSLEPDRYVILGNHRDAWVLGALDPSSGTAVMLEVARAIGQVIREDEWQPRRSIMFCSWAAEEMGTLGSPEWVEEHIKTLADNGVVYLNVDIAVEGGFSFIAKATPNLHQVLYNATKKIKDASCPDKSVYEIWLERNPSEDKKQPKVDNIGSGSDFIAFMSAAGISSMDFRYKYNRTSMPSLIQYPAYHSLHDSFSYVKKFVDPDFRYQQTIARVWAELARVFADSLILPYDCIEYGYQMKTNMEKIKLRYGAEISERGLTFDFIDKSLDEFVITSQQFHEYINTMEQNDPLAIRKVNDHLMYLDRAFLDPAGLPGRPLYKHVVYAPSSRDIYSGDAFPGLVDALFDIENSKHPDNQWKEVEKHMSVLAYFIHGAALKLKAALQ